MIEKDYKLSKVSLSQESTVAFRKPLPLEEFLSVLALKRPLAVIGYSMLITFLVVTNITHKMTIALLTGAVVIFLLFIAFKRLRKQLFVIFSLSGVILFSSLLLPNTELDI